MEVNCPSCGAHHRSEDYPGAFDILCGCGYLILNPDLGAGSSSVSEYNEINFEGPPVVDETKAENLIKVESQEEEFKLNIDFNVSNEEAFSAEALTPPEELPEGMLYDPSEIPHTQTDAEILNFSDDSIPKAAKPESTLSKIFVEKVQKASIGQILGPDFDLEFLNLSPEAKLKARERIEKFLNDHKWLREEMERRSFIVSESFQNEKTSNIPEPLAVEMYIACLENGGECIFNRHSLKALSA